MAALGAQSIASSYEQLLHVDRDGGGNSTTHVSVKDGDNGTTFGFTIASDALMMSSTNRLEFGDTGTYIHQSADGVLDLVSDTEIEINATTIDMNGALDLSGNAQLSGTVTVGADGSGTDVIFYSGTAGDNLTWDASAEKLTITGTDGQTSLDVADGNVSITDNLDVDGTTNLDAVDIDGNVQLDGTFTVGTDGSGQDVILYSGTAGDNFTWDSSEEKLTITGTNGQTALDVADGNVSIADDLAVDGTSNLDNTDIDGTLAVDGATISLDATTSFNIDNSNTSNGVTINTATSGGPISIGHTTSETTVNDNLVVTGDIDLAGSIDCDGTANLDNTDIDGTLTQDAGNVVFNEDSGDYDFRVESNGNANMLFVDGGTDSIGIGTNAPMQYWPLHVYQGDAGTDPSWETTEARNLALFETDNTEGSIAIFAPANATGLMYSFAEPGTRITGGMMYSNNTNTMTLQTNANDRVVIDSSGATYIGDTANGSMTTGLTINQGASDDEIMAFKSSDVAHPMTAEAEADTYGKFFKHTATAGGLQISGFKDADGTAEGALALTGFLGEAADTTKSNSGGAVINLTSIITDGSTGATVVGSDGNLVAIHNAGNARFIFDAEGSFHADVESTTFDHYEDAQLVRAFDLSHGKDVIVSKFDEFIDYNHETLADLKLVGREEDGTPNKFLNVTKLQQLHNGAIWQQYTEMQKMKELMYDTMVEMLGKEKADQKLTDHDIQLLDNKTLLN